MPALYQPRFYRGWVRDSDLVSFTVVVKESDLLVRARRNLRAKALKSCVKHRESLEKYIREHPLFLTTLVPYDPGAEAPSIVRGMSTAGAVAGVGPMAAVAGAIAEEVGKDLAPFTGEVIIENGGDIYMKVTRERLVGIYAGDSPLSGKVGVAIRPQDTPVGISTSSGTVGHSLSFGQADAATVVARTAYLSDAVATALGNRVKTVEDIPGAIEWAQTIPGLMGVVIIKGDRMGAWGKIRVVSL